MITEREDGRIESISLPWNREDVKYIAESWFDEPIKLTEDDMRIMYQHSMTGELFK